MNEKAKSKTSGRGERRLLLGAAGTGKSRRLIERLQAEAAKSGEEAVIICDPASELTGRSGGRQLSRLVGESGIEPSAETWTHLSSGNDDRIADWMFGLAPRSSSEKFFRKAGASLLRRMFGHEAASNVPPDFPGGDENESLPQERDEDSPGQKALRLFPDRPKTERRCWRT